MNRWIISEEIWFTTCYKKTIICFGFIIIILISMFILGGCQNKPSNSGITGTTVIGPINPVEKEGETNQKPYPDAEIIVKSEDGGREIARARVDKKGTFRINLPAGKYILEPVNIKGGIMPTGKSMEISVLPNQFTDVIVEFDSGIR